MRKIYQWIVIILLLVYLQTVNSQKITQDKIYSTLKRATEFWDKEVDSTGRFVWYYTLDLKRRWGEMEAYPSMGWLQGEGMLKMGETFLDLYEATRDTYYLHLAYKVARALIKGQLPCGGWNYMIDEDGEESIKQWYQTIGRSGWRLEEFHYYYGNATFDDEVTFNATMFLIRLQLTLPSDKVLQSIQKVIQMVRESQYSVGAWPQRYPHTDSLYQSGYPSYPSFYTFNDDVTWNNICLLLIVRKLFNDSTLDDSIRRGMNSYRHSQLKPPQAGWAQQYTTDLKPAPARSYEPAALDPIYTAKHCEILLKFFELTGDAIFLSCIPSALQWIKSVVISEIGDSLVFVPKFIEVGTNKPLFIHRRGSNRIYGKYFIDKDSTQTIGHYRNIRPLNLKNVELLYDSLGRIQVEQRCNFSLPVIDTIQNNLCKFHLLRDFLTLQSERLHYFNNITEEQVLKIINQLDEKGRWTTTYVMISNPYRGIAPKGDSETTHYARTYVGDEYDTSPYLNNTTEHYLSTGLYIRNVAILLQYLNTVKAQLR